MAINPDHPCPADFSLGVDMLVAMDEEFRLLHADVFRESIKASMNFVILVVDSSGRVVRGEDINMREGLQQVSRFILLIEKMASGFVLPRTVESPETDSKVLADRKVEIHNWHGKGDWGIMVAFDGKAVVAVFFVKKKLRQLFLRIHRIAGEDRTAEIHGRHDPIIVPRAVVVAEAMAALTAADLLLMSMTSRLDRMEEFFERMRRK